MQSDTWEVVAMGTLFRFACPECGYEGVVAGGLSRGMLAITHTVSCPSCKELSDMTLAEEPLEFLAWLDREELNEDEVRQKTEHAPWMPERIRCDLDRRHKASLWRHPGPCPRCGTTLAKGEMAVMWD